MSIVVPFYNEEESIGPMYEALRNALEPLDFDYELLFVDDGSRDATFQEARALAAKDHRLRVIRFRKNYGQTPAMAAGIDHARGKVLVTMDGDLQNDPRDIPNLLAKIEEGYDVVVGWRHNRQDKFLTRKIPSKIANWLIGKVTGVPIKDNGCSLKAYRAEIVQNVPLYSEMHRFIPAMLSMTGASIAEIKVRHHARKYGRSKYGLARIFKVLSDLLAIKTLISLAARPMVWFGKNSIAMLMISGVVFIAALVQVLAAPDGSIVVPLSLSMIFASLGLFLLFCGTLSDLVYKTSDFRSERLSSITTRVINGNE